ncbi:hypothetical protein [Kordiimonas marina]|uniref:hypothetical protein n=1 Tax=Kordiimonas marina TaxID=2872312 RepID=UPI001FF3A02E|nr:hypothetical protein [Kordiimonas marina]MCJ9429309.1 hypothetical protein [Kordiimonas marina]
MSFPEDVLSRAGRILYRELPDEYRYRDNPTASELGDLEAYLQGFGHVLDLIRRTTEQAYADAFAEATETGDEIQPWLLPYLAELVGADLFAPDEDRRREELNNSVLWSKSKGTLRNVDQVGDVISGAETMVREGWRLTLTCPRPALPPFSVPKVENPNDQLGRTPVPLGCPDFRVMDRAVADPDGANPLFRLRYPGRDAKGMPLEIAPEIFWKPRAADGVPCFPGGYADNSARCPDLRDPDLNEDLGPHPGRSLVYLRPPDGLFEKGLRVMKVADPAVFGIQAGAAQQFDPRSILKLVAGEDGEAPDRIIVELGKDMTIPAGADVTFRHICFTGRVGSGNAAKPVRLQVQTGGRLSLHYCAAEKVVLTGNGSTDDPDRPALYGWSSLFGSVIGPNRFARLVYCTVMEELDLMRLQASDCLFAVISSNLKCAEDESCIRYSRFTAVKALEACFSKQAPTNTNKRPRFILRYLPEGKKKGCVLRLPRYGEAGYGVLDILTDAAISAGAEDEGEMGAYHEFYFAAQVRALRKKLQTYLPLGQEISLAYDPLMTLVPPVLVGSGGD